jgi:peptidoglycan/LPS O-acetylase OafA/YrhL
LRQTTASKDQAGHGRIDDVEVLRAFAVGLVLVQHAAWNLIPWQMPNQGPLYGHFGFWSGVDLFFAISGFVIGRSLLPQLAGTRSRGEFFATSLSFWVRRMWRLWPTAWLWVAVMLALAAWFNTTGAFDPFPINLEGAIAAVLNVENFRLRYALAHGKTGVTAIYWTLSLEEQFYLVLPILAFLTRRRLALALAAIAGAQLFLDRTTGYSSLMLNLTRSDGLALGVLLAIWSERDSYRRVEPRWLGRAPWPFLLAPVFLVVFAAVTGPTPGHRFTMGAVTLLSAAMVWVASYDRGYVFPTSRLKDALCWLGARSYAIYLIHLPVYHASMEFWTRVRPTMLQASPLHLAVLIGGALAAILALADLNYRFVEVPLRRRGARIAQRIRARGQLAAAEPASEPALGV